MPSPSHQLSSQSSLKAPTARVKEKEYKGKCSDSGLGKAAYSVACVPLLILAPRCLNDLGLIDSVERINQEEATIFSSRTNTLHTAHSSVES